VTNAADSLAVFLERSRAHVDAALERFLPKPPACPALLAEAMRYSVFAGGKRLRPILTLTAADAVRQRQDLVARGTETDRHAIDEALPAACAIELIHTYSLIHDDLPAMDDDTLRRGRPTLHVVYGDGIAILAGDGLQAEALALVAREPDTNDPAVIARKLRAVRIIAEAAGVVGMVGGQAIDLQAAAQVPGHHLVLDAASLQAMHVRKTGAIICAAAESGAVMGGAPDALVADVARWGAEIGLAFQIVDDILDVEGTSEQLGKTAGKDAASHKPTYPSLFGIDRSRTLARECSERARTTLEAAGLAETRLQDVANWVIMRKS
jgi:geranylgeranyl diphosphate synthase type II